MPCHARLLPIAMSVLPPARGDGLGAGAGRPRPATSIAGLLIGAAIGAMALGPLHGLIAIGVAAGAIAATAAIVQRRIAGYTGDVLGAFQQIAEIAILLTAAALR